MIILQVAHFSLEEGNKSLILLSDGYSKLFTKYPLSAKMGKWGPGQS